MNAPEQMQQHEITLIPLDQLLPSPTNPRKRFNGKALQDLATSISLVGIAQPILVRVALQDDGYGAVENKGNYEIVAGERRFRAAKRAGLEAVPCYVRNLTDQQVLHLQIIENLHREDLHPMEEAESFKHLMGTKNDKGETYTADMIAAEIGMSRSHVFQRMKLLDLCDQARDAFFNSELDSSIALLIARIPVHKVQIQAMEKIIGNEIQWSTSHMARGEKMTFRRAQELIHEEFMLDLERAPFDPEDAKLKPDAGNCTSCPKRTGNAADLFNDVEDPNICTDTVCFGLKKTAHILNLQKAAEANGATVIKGGAAKKLIKQYQGDEARQLLNNGFVTLDTKVPDDKQKRTIGQLLDELNLTKPTLSTGKPIVQKTVVLNPLRDNSPIETVNIETATKALREAGYEISLKQENRQQQSQQDRNKQAEKDKKQLALENTFRARLFETLHQQIEAEMENAQAPIFPKINSMLAAWMLNVVLEYDDDVLRHILPKYFKVPTPAEGEEINWWDVGSEAIEKIDELTPHQHSLLMIDLLMSDEIEIMWFGGQNQKGPANMLKIADEIGINADAIKQELAAEARAAERKDKTADAKKPAPKPIEIPAAAQVRPAATWPFPMPAVKETPNANPATADTPQPAAPAKTKSAAKKKAAPAAKKGAEA